MPNPMKYADNAQGAIKCTSTHETGKLLSEIKQLQEQLTRVKQDFEIEKNCKNQAYYWIISTGNLKRFAEFCKKHLATLDYHGVCVAQLYLKAITNENK